MTLAGLVEGIRAWGFGHAQAALSSLGSVCRAPLGTTLTTLVIGVALALPAAALILVGNLSDVSTHFGTKTEISVFLKPDITDDHGGILSRQISEMDQVEGVRVITKEAALEEFRAAAQVGYGLEALGGSNPLPVVLVVAPGARDGPGMAGLVSALNDLPEVDFIQDDRDWLARLDALAQVVQRFLWLLSLALSLGIVLVVGNTVRLSIESRRDEVEVSKLFGASDAFVRRPFLYHGLYYGLAGAVLAWMLLVVSGLVLEPALDRLSALYSGRLSVRGVGLQDLLGLLLTGGGLGLLGAWIWVGRHLRRVEPR